PEVSADVPRAENPDFHGNAAPDQNVPRRSGIPNVDALGAAGFFSRFPVPALTSTCTGGAFRPLIRRTPPSTWECWLSTTQAPPKIAVPTPARTRSVPPVMKSVFDVWVVPSAWKVLSVPVAAAR